jgi:CheY-like chemotaxis protein
MNTGYSQELRWNRDAKNISNNPQGISEVYLLRHMMKVLRMIGLTSGCYPGEVGAIEDFGRARATPCILVAEDHEDDIFFMRRAFNKARLSSILRIVRDGQEAVDYLAGRPPYTDRVLHPFPSLLLLDLNMPRMNGFDVLVWLRGRPTFSDLPVVVFSTSDLEEDIARARELGANEYCVKPLGVDGLVGFVKELHDRWLTQPIALT